MLTRCIVLALLSAPVGAADFRGLNFGDSCASVPSREEARGSIAIPWKSPSGADISRIFKGREYERDLTIVYFCSDGGLLGGNYFFQSEPLDAQTAHLRTTMAFAPNLPSEKPGWRVAIMISENKQ
jgi:hypothetical protein